MKQNGEIIEDVVNITVLDKGLILKHRGQTEAKLLFKHAMEAIAEYYGNTVTNIEGEIDKITINIERIKS